MLLHAPETLTLKESDRKKLGLFQMWCHRRLLMVPWTARHTNASILQELGIIQKIMLTITHERILKYFVHIARKQNNLEMLVGGKVSGKSSRRLIAHCLGYRPSASEFY